MLVVDSLGAAAAPPLNEFILTPFGVGRGHSNPSRPAIQALNRQDDRHRDIERFFKEAIERKGPGARKARQSGSGKSI
jgi:hypothetical protein